MLCGLGALLALEHDFEVFQTVSLQFLFKLCLFCSNDEKDFVHRRVITVKHLY